jgi:hypothetical protein
MNNLEQIVTKCDTCGSRDLEFENKTVGCRECMEIIHVEEEKTASK